MSKAWRPSLSRETREELEEFEAASEKRWGDLFGLDMRSRHFNRDGEAISMADWIEAAEDPAYKRVAEDTIEHWWISTVWLGLDHGFSLDSDAPPVIFETMVFDNSKEGLAESAEVAKRSGMTSIARLGPDAYCGRYSTERQALHGHKQAVVAAEAGLIRREETIETHT